MEARLPVRPACYLPPQLDLRPRQHSRALIVRRHIASVLELIALGAFFAAIFIWSLIQTGGL